MWGIENTNSQVLVIIDNGDLIAYKILGKKESIMEEKALQEKRWAQREPKRKKKKIKSI